MAGPARLTLWRSRLVNLRWTIYCTVYHNLKGFAQNLSQYKELYVLLLDCNRLIMHGVQNTPVSNVENPKKSWLLSYICCADIANELEWNIVSEWGRWEPLDNHLSTYFQVFRYSVKQWNTLRYTVKCTLAFYCMYTVQYMKDFFVFRLFYAKENEYLEVNQRAGPKLCIPGIHSTG